MQTFLLRALKAAAPAFLLMTAAPGGASAQAADVELWRLDCGKIAVSDLNAFSDAFAYPGQTKTLTNSCYLIRHGAAYMLWDTGFAKAMIGTAPAVGSLSPTLDKTLVDQLKEIGVAPEKITVVGISHNHFDHVGQAAEFPGATLLIGKGDLDAFRADPLPFGVDPALIKPWLDGGAKVDPVEGDRDVFGDGAVIMLATPGHTHDSHSLLVRLNQTGPVILSGDTVHFEEQFATRGVPPFNVDRAETLASMERLQTMAANLKATLVVQHDAADIAKLPAFPKSAK